MNGNAKDTPPGKLRKVMAIMQVQAEEATPDPRVALLSITEPGKPAALADGWGDLLRVEFHDLSHPLPGHKIATPEDARAILSFIERAEARFPLLLVHCAAGVSRSGAVARFVSRRNKFPYDFSDPTYNHHLYRLLCEEEAKT